MNTKIIFLLIIFAGAILRFADLGDYPAGFFRDEAAMGYNSYSIWLTGKDEYGVSFPLVLRSFEVFFLPLYVYISAPIVGILGLSEFSTRFLSAFAGTVALVIIFFLAYEIWKNKKLALISTLVLAISPWHIFYSRGAFEGNLALTLFSVGFLFWLKFIDTPKVRFFLFSTIFFVLSIYSYQSERLVVPIFGLIAITLAFKKIWPIKKSLLLPLFAVTILLLPLLSLTFKPGGYHRALGVSVFTDQRHPPGWVQGNELYLRLRQLMALYLSYFSPKNIFFEGDYDMQRGVEKFSVFYGFMLPFMLLGLIVLFKQKNVKSILLLAWIFLAPIPASLTTDPFHTYRSLMLYMPLSLLVAFGMYTAGVHFKRYSYLYSLGISLFVVFNLNLFIYSFMVLTKATRAPFWDYGYKQVVENILAQTDYKGVRVDDPKSEAYIHFLFFGKVDPIIYHQEVKKFTDPKMYYYTSAEKIRPIAWGKYEFRHVDWPTERGDTGTIFVMREETLPVSEFKTDPKVKLLKEIYYPDGSIAFRIVKII